MGFEAMPQIADLEIAATWDEIELEAALRSRSDESLSATSPEALSTLAEALRAVEALKQLPREERKRRAEELLRALTRAPAEPAASEDPAPQPSPLDTPVTVEPVASAGDEAPPEPEQDPAEPIAAPVENSVPVLADAPSAEPTAAPPEASELAAVPSTSDEPAAVATETLPPSEEPVAAEPSATPSTTEAVADASADPDSVKPSLLQAALEMMAASEPPPSTDAAPAADTAPEAAAGAPTVEAVAVAEPVAASTVVREADAIPSFLKTECATFEAEQLDQLIPFRTLAAAGALIGAVLGIYLWSSQEFGLAARPILGTSEIADTRAAPPKISASLAVRRALVALPPDFATGPQAVRPYRPPFVGFDFLDDPVPAAPTTVEAEPSSVPSPTALVIPAASTEEVAALPSPPVSEVAALIKRGDDLLKAGDIAAARSAFERAAAQGNAKAQIGVGMTYDPLVLSKLGARGVRGDPVQAAAWYARAGESGDDEGQQRLHALISGLSDCMLSQGACGNRRP